MVDLATLHAVCGELRDDVVMTLMQFQGVQRADNDGSFIRRLQAEGEFHYRDLALDDCSLGFRSERNTVRLVWGFLWPWGNRTGALYICFPWRYQGEVRIGKLEISWTGRLYIALEGRRNLLRSSRTIRTQEDLCACQFQVPYMDGGEVVRIDEAGVHVIPLEHSVESMRPNGEPVQEGPRVVSHEESIEMFEGIRTGLRYARVGMSELTTRLGIHP